MIVCLCKNVSHRHVEAAIDNGADSLEALQRRCSGAGGGCGACKPMLLGLLSTYAPDGDDGDETVGASLLGGPMLASTAS